MSRSDVMAMAPVLMKLGDDRVVNLAEVSAFHRDGDKLFVHYGGKIWSYTGSVAAEVWAAVQRLSFDPAGVVSLVPGEQR